MTLDLEKARKIVDAMSPTPWIVLEDRYGQIDVIRNPNHPMHEEGIIELQGKTSETATPDAIGISYMRSEFPNALDEIERLRAMTFNLEKAQDATKMYNSRNPNVNTTIWAHNCAEHLQGAIDLIEHQADKIRELEEEIERLAKPNALDDWGNPIVLSVSGGVYDPPAAKGKIGPDAETAHHECQECDDEFCDEDECPKSQCWQITEGRKDALAQCIFELEDIMDDRPFFREEIDVLRAMIEEAK